MSVIAALRELVRVFGQSVAYAAQRRSVGLAAFILLGGILVMIVLLATVASPALIYPLL